MRRFVTVVLTGSLTWLTAVGCSSTPDLADPMASTSEAESLNPVALCEGLIETPNELGTIVPFTTTFDGTLYAVVISPYTTIQEVAAQATTGVPVVDAKVTPVGPGNCDGTYPGGTTVIGFTSGDISLITNAAKTYVLAHESKNQQCESGAGVPYCAMCGCCMGGACPTTTKGCSPNRCQ